MSDSEKIPKIRLSKKQIREGLKAVPIERILLGAAEMGGRQLTAKQVAFAEALAMGETKAGAYRKVYKSKGKPKTTAREGHKLSRDPKIAAVAEAKRAEMEGEKSQTPAQIREMTIRALVRHAQDEEFPPAQRVKALELLGKITEVALFTERREVVKVTDSGEIRERLLASIREAMKADAIEVEAREADSLMAEIRSGEDAPIPAGATPPTADPPNFASDTPAIVHSIPHPQSASEVAHLPDFEGEVQHDLAGEDTSTCPPVQVDFPLEIKEIDPKCSLT